MTACVEIKFGTLMLVISSMYIPYRKVDATQNASYEMRWTKWRNWKAYCPTSFHIISCSRVQPILILNAYIESGPNQLNLSDSSSSNEIGACNCEARCFVPCVETRYKLGDSRTTTLHVKYQCTNDDCSDDIGSTTSTSSDTSTTHIQSSVKANTTSRSSPSTMSQLPLSTTKTTALEKTSPEQSSTSGNHIMTVSLSETTSVARSTIYNTTVHATNKPQFDLYSGTDEKNTETVAIAVCVSVTGLAGCILAVILFRRWWKKKTIDYVYNNNTTTQNADMGYANLTYSETANKDDTQSHSADSGYTDMRVDETLDDTNNDYYSIQEGKEETLRPENDNYYAIKDNAGQEYNKITFKPKSVPEDPSYVHTLRAINIKDKTYDHVDGKECIKFVLQNDDYSHLNQCKDHSCNTIRCNPTGEAFKGDGAAIWPNEKEDGYTHDHKYFTLEMNKYSRQTEVDKENDVSHDYFVLEKEIPTKMSLPDGNGVSKKHANINAVVAIQKSDHSISSTDHEYFENCRQVDAESDSHKYQALEPHTSETMEKFVENVNHDYFILDKESNATETDRETDVSHTYFVLEDEIPANNNSEDDNDFRKKQATVHAASTLQHSSKTSSSEHTYFENCLQAGSESDTHQYKTLEQHILEQNVECQKEGP